MTERTRVRSFKKIVKYDGGHGALLCNKCRVVIATGFKHEDREHHCDKCKPQVIILGLEDQQ